MIKELKEVEVEALENQVRSKFLVLPKIYIARGYSNYGRNDINDQYQQRMPRQ